ncbi:MAG: COX15/CtaA family protein [Flavobacteriales bacterium]|nr:COX15/CtaA family protein [Flavobacteriales bacterium]MCC6938420.1 COX15/CtaA family protein [Flavobacteriales bacterium]
MRPVIIWLITGCVMIACMVVIGGITRLTESGLSITEWKPISGAIPPMNDAAWQAEFEAYKRIPEYSLMNADMDLPGFKRIYFWEYLHRNWGRLMGLVFAIPFVVFWRQGRLKGWLMKRTLWILLGGAVVASLGWFMVKSGLVDQKDSNGQLLVDVSHFRLAIHLVAALFVLALALWTVFDLRDARRAFVSNGSAPGKWLRVALVLLALQVIWGAFTAGLNAGSIYNSWPLMNGAFMPENATAFGSFWKDFADHKDGVQFVHRNLAWLVAAVIVGVAIHYRRHAQMRNVWLWLVATVCVQFALGVFALLTSVRIELGVLHQLGAVVLLAVLVKALHATGRRTPATSA